MLAHKCKKKKMRKNDKNILDIMLPGFKDNTNCLIYTITSFGR